MNADQDTMGTAIVAVSKNAMIERRGSIPWRMLDDLQHFRRVTDASIIVVGRKTFDTLPDLPNRRIVVLTQNPAHVRRRKHGAAPWRVVSDPREAASIAARETRHNSAWFICGGAETYVAMAPWTHRALITLVHCTVIGHGVKALWATRAIEYGHSRNIANRIRVFDHSHRNTHNASLWKIDLSSVETRHHIYGGYYADR